MTRVPTNVQKIIYRVPATVSTVDGTRFQIDIGNAMVMYGIRFSIFKIVHKIGPKSLLRGQ